MVKVRKGVKMVDVKSAKTVVVPLPKPESPCHICGCTIWNYVRGGAWVCARCHPAPEGVENEHENNMS